MAEEQVASEQKQKKKNEIRSSGDGVQNIWR
jgi:hypothetical protein